MAINAYRMVLPGSTKYLVDKSSASGNPL